MLTIPAVQPDIDGSDTYDRLAIEKIVIGERGHSGTLAGKVYVRKCRVVDDVPEWSSVTQSRFFTLPDIAAFFADAMAGLAGQLGPATPLVDALAMVFLGAAAAKGLGGVADE